MTNKSLEYEHFKLDKAFEITKSLRQEVEYLEESLGLLSRTEVLTEQNLSRLENILIAFRMMRNSWRTPENIDPHNSPNGDIRAT